MSVKAKLQGVSSPLERLPLDAHEAMLPYLGSKAMGSLSITCRHFHTLVQGVMHNETALQELVRLIPGMSASQSWQRMSTLHGPLCMSYPVHARVSCFQMTSDGKRALVGFENGNLVFRDFEMWDMYLSPSHGHHGEICSLQITPDNKRALSGSQDQSVKFWDLETGACLWTLNGHGGPVFCLRITGDGRRAVSGSEDGTLIVWDLETGAALRTLVGHGGPVKHVYLTPDERRAVSGSRYHTVKVWDLDTGECLSTLIERPHTLTRLQMTPDGKRVLAGFQDGTLQLTDVETGQSLQTLTLPPRICSLDYGGMGQVLFERDNWICDLQMTPDGKRALTASVDHNLRLWDLDTGAHLCTLTGHTDLVYNLQFTPDGNNALSVSCDGTLRLWFLERGEGRIIAEHLIPACCLEISSDGRRVLVGDEGQIDSGGPYLLRLWDLFPLPEEHITAVARKCFHRPARAMKAVAGLPRFARDDLSAIVRARASTHPNRIAESLDIYNATRVALPGIEAALRRARKEPVFLAESLQRVDHLRSPIRKVIYEHLCQIHRDKGTLPQQVPDNYGESAFLTEGGSSIEERVEAVTRTIAFYKGLVPPPQATNHWTIGFYRPQGLLFGPRAALQLAIAHQPQVVLRIIEAVTRTFRLLFRP